MRLLRFAAATAAASLLAVLVPATATAIPATTDRGSAVVDVRKSELTDKQIRALWTPERMKEALRNPAKAPAPRAERDGAAKSVAPDRNLTASAPAQGFSAGAALPQARAAAEPMPAMPVSQEAPTGPGYNIVGKLFFFEPSGKPSHCSAASITSANENTIWTAGHCVHLGDGSGDAGWMKHFLYVPGYRNGAEPLGSWTFAHRFAPTAWTQDGDSDEADMAAIVLNSHPTHGTLLDAVGFAFGYLFTENRTDYANTATMGYPVEGYNRSDLDGERPMYCVGDTTDASSLNPFDDRIKIDCDMGEGSSGGAYVWGENQADPRIVGAISHSEKDRDTLQRVNDDLFSSEHGSYAAAVINMANSV
ncbi:trypsin-like serine peptidase [Streptomyces sp. NPDC056527]|uniref:trypsin-like serine peptidase n=1 Tax=Streptomyces sp. NPDC056527 TaxID=3345853 RepID=UPI00368C6E7E